MVGVYDIDKPIVMEHRKSVVIVDELKEPSQSRSYSFERYSRLGSDGVPEVFCRDS